MPLKKPRNFLVGIILFGMSALAAGGYLFASARMHGPGFPLDDAWIHQTYARNLGVLGEWSFIPGLSSAGSTSPLWTGLLSIGYILRINDIFLWPYLLGILSLLGLAFAGEFASRELVVAAAESRLPWLGIFLAAEYHLVWAAVSGMETNLMAAVIMAFYLLILRRKVNWLMAGCVIGLSVWIRPDGITLLGPALWVMLLESKPWRDRGIHMLRLAGGFGLFFVPYLLFNLRVEGSIWPNTFYAKQAEYASLQAQPILLRYLGELGLPLVGAGLLLLPGFIYQVVRAVSHKDWKALAGVLWFLGYAGLYAWRLPVTYQYGRYLMPAMPVYFVLGLTGWLGLFRASKPSNILRLSEIAYRFALAGVLMGFYYLGAKNYARDVAIIQTEMVTTAKWIAEHTTPEELIAVHDIGAVGYYSQRNIVDLAGLVTPEVIPFIRDEAALARYLDQRGVDLLVVFPGWYSALTRGREAVFTSAGQIAPQAGGENMTVYRWR